jgi:hypothetical protein
MADERTNHDEKDLIRNDLRVDNIDLNYLTREVRLAIGRYNMHDLTTIRQENAR